MALAERQSRKRAEAVQPFLEPGETVVASFIGQTPIPPITYLLIGPLLFIFILKFRTVVVTERNLYVFANRFLQTYTFAPGPYKVPAAQAKVEFGSMYLQVDDGPKLWVMPFGPVKRSLDNFVSEAKRIQSGGGQATATGASDSGA